MFGGQILDYVYRKVCPTLFSFEVLNRSQESAKNGGKGKPEFRLPLLIIGSFIIPVGLLSVSLTV